MKTMEETTGRSRMERGFIEFLRSCPAAIEPSRRIIRPDDLVDGNCRNVLSKLVGSPGKYDRRLLADYLSGLLIGNIAIRLNLTPEGIGEIEASYDDATITAFTDLYLDLKKGIGGILASVIFEKIQLDEQVKDCDRRPVHISIGEVR